jgi:N-acyl homoserine lactone hydrolase
MATGETEQAVKTELHLLRSGAIPVAPGYLFRDRASNLAEALGRGVKRSERIVIPIGAFLIEHPSEGPILVDTGIHPVVVSNPKRNMGRVLAVVVRGLRLSADETVPAQLRQAGIEPRDIRTIVMTHLHLDHSSAMSEFDQARFVTTREEWRAARSRLGALSGYVRSHLPPESAVDFVEFATGQPWQGLERTIDLFGDGSIRLVSTPGHSVGHFSVLVQTTKGPVFLLGDAVYTLRNLHEDRLPWRTASDQDSLDSMRQLRAYAEGHPDVPLIPSHDPEVWDARE